MFSLIVTIIAVALVAALALATIYYGGNAINKGGASAQASQALLQGQQILGAMELFKADNGRYPGIAAQGSSPAVDGMQELVQNKYLTSVPELTSKSWAISAPGVAGILLPPTINQEVCRQINLKARGDDGILLKAYEGLALQCYGDSAANLKVTWTKEPDALKALVPGTEVAATKAPPPSGDPAYLVQPGAAPTQGGSEQSGGGGSPSAAVTTNQSAASAKQGQTAPVLVTLTNTKSTAASLSFGAAPSPFTYDAASSTCGPSLSPGANCTLAFLFSADTVGYQSRDYTIVVDGEPVIIQLEGVGRLPDSCGRFGCSPVGATLEQAGGQAPIDFGVLAPGNVVTRTIVISNIGNTTAVGLQAIRSSFIWGWTISLSGCTGDLAPGQSCILRMTASNIPAYEPAEDVENRGFNALLDFGSVATADQFASTALDFSGRVNRP